MEERRAQDAESDGEGGKKRWEEEEKMGRRGRGGKVRLGIVRLGSGRWRRSGCSASLVLGSRCAAKKESVPVASLLVPRRLGGGSGGFARRGASSRGKKKNKRYIVICVHEVKVLEKKVPSSGSRQQGRYLQRCRQQANTSSVSRQQTTEPRTHPERERESRELR